MQENDNSAIMNTIATGLTHPVDVFMTMNFLTKTCVTVTLMVGMVALVLAILRSARGGRRSSVLDLLGTIGLVAGVLGGAYDAFVTWQVAHMLHETRLLVVLPGIVEAMMAMMSGLIVWLIAGFGNAGAKRA